jgi:hypothetical protein
VFAKTKIIPILGGLVKKLEFDVFKDLTGLKCLAFRIYNSKGLIHANGIEWLHYLNYYHEPFKHDVFEDNYLSRGTMKALFKNKKIVYIQNMEHNDYLFVVKFFPLIDYEFPEEDFCMFANYPHEKLIFTVVNIYSNSCSCTILWVYKHMAFYVQNGIGMRQLLDDYADEHDEHGFLCQLVGVCHKYFGSCDNLERAKK